MKSILRAAALGFALSACETPDATQAILANAYPQIADGGDTTKEMTIWKAWYAVSQFADPIAPGQDSPANRLVPVNDVVYVLVAPGWDPASTTPPTALIAMKTSATHPVARGETVRIEINDDTAVGNCAAGKPLSQADADFVTQIIFPGDFAGAHYDAKTCTAVPSLSDGGADAPVDAPGG